MCLTGVDYYSTLGYQPGIAALAAGVLSPVATLVLVLLTLAGALPIYRRVARESPNGQGSIAMLEKLLPQWKGKLLVLVLLGFVATDFVITMTLSAADASAHALENPFMPEFLRDHQVLLTLVLLAALGAVFLKGFTEAIGIAVTLVGVYLALNVVVVVTAILHVVGNPEVVLTWQNLLTSQYGNPWLMIGVALLVFPKLALGLSGFETGVAVMPQVRGAAGDTATRPEGRIRNTRRLLTTAALIMSVFLICSSFVTTVLIPQKEFQSGGSASGRALAYLAHSYLGDAFGTVYDLSTIGILWFAGASAMAGLLNIVPRYLPGYGMAPDWVRSSRPLVLVFMVIAFAITIIFEANVDAQGGAYATGVLVLISSAALAVTLSAVRRRQRPATIAFAVITAVFAYTTVMNIVERPDGVKIASFFILAIIVTSFVSRATRSLELRFSEVQFDETARRLIAEHAAEGEIRIIANEPDARDEAEYVDKEREQREDNHIPAGDPVLFLEITIGDSSDFTDELDVCGEERFGYKILKVNSPTVPNAIAAILMRIREDTGKVPHVYFAWAEGNPFQFLFKYMFSGSGDVPPVTREVLRRAEPDPERRPMVHVG
ncbi:amino acid transporter [Kutzneria albida]|nr:amino acid transporter [Kutzneria albida]